MAENSGLTTTVESGLELRQVEETLTKFTGTDKTYTVARWAEDMNDNAEIFKWTPVQKLLIARRSLVGAAALWLRSEKTFKTYEKLKAALSQEFPDCVNVKEIHEIMVSRKKRKDETYYEYMLVMKELGKRGNFPDYVAIQYIIDGIVDIEINKVMLYGVTTYSKLKESLAIYETMKSKERRSNLTRSEPARIERHCFKCGEKGHIANLCRNGLKCFKCNLYGHIAPDCRVTNSNLARGEKDGRYIKTGGDAQDSGLAAHTWQKACTACVKSSVEHPIKAGKTDEQLSCQCQCHPDRVQNKQQNRNVIEPHCLPELNTAVKKVKVGGVNFNSLVNSNSDMNLLSSELFFELSVTSYVKDSTLVRGLGSVRVEAIGKCYTVLEIDGQCYELLFYIVPEDVMPYNLVLGRPLLDVATVVFSEGEASVRPRCENMLVQCLLSDSKQQVSYIPNSPIRENSQNLEDSYKPKQLKGDPIQTKMILNEDIPMVKQPRCLSSIEQQAVEQQIGEFLPKSKPSCTEYASLVKKKDWANNVCVDYHIQQQQK